MKIFILNLLVTMAVKIKRRYPLSFSRKSIVLPMTQIEIDILGDGDYKENINKYKIRAARSDGSTVEFGNIFELIGYSTGSKDLGLEFVNFELLESKE